MAINNIRIIKQTHKQNQLVIHTDLGLGLIRWKTVGNCLDNKQCSTCCS